MRYPIVLHKDPNTEYGVTVPDLPGCFSAGSDIEQAIDNAQEAILCHVEGILIDNEPLPTANSIEHHQANADYADGISWALVDVDLSAISGKAKRVNITMSEGILSRIDAVTNNRSGFLADAALEYIDRHNV
jgi:predicted RNase H-like HicB family nuclease